MKITKENKEYLNKALANKVFVKFLRKYRCLTKYKYYTLHSDVNRKIFNYDVFNIIGNAFIWWNTGNNMLWYDLHNEWIDTLKIICQIKKKKQ